MLFAFLLVVPFSQGFSSVSTPQRYVYFATMLCIAVSGVLLLAPSSPHRLLWRQAVLTFPGRPGCLPQFPSAGRGPYSL